jgi:hypothetical protein
MSLKCNAICSQSMLFWFLIFIVAIHFNQIARDSKSIGGQLRFLDNKAHMGATVLLYYTYYISLRTHFSFHL